MGDERSENSENEVNISLSDVSHVVTARPTFHLLVVNHSVPNDEVLDCEDIDPPFVGDDDSDSDCVVVAASEVQRKRKLQCEDKVARHVTIDTDTDVLPGASGADISAGERIAQHYGSDQVTSQKRLCVRLIPLDHVQYESSSSSIEVKAFSQWANLPQPLVVTVMSYLNNPSRLQMALTCKAWARLIKSAKLWRNLKVELSAFRTIEKPIIQYAKTHGRHINNVVVTWRRPSYILSTKLHTMLSRILCHLKNQAEVKNFRMHYMELDRYWRFEAKREKLLAAIAEFAASQRKLKVFVMNCAQICSVAGCKILEGVTAHCADTVETLNIEDFFRSHIAAFRIQKYVQTITKFANVKHLSLNYNCLNEEIVEQFAKTGKLQTLSVKVYKNDPHYHKIPGCSWSRLRRSCPKLEVNMEFDQVPSFTDILPILLPEIPVKCLYVWSGYVEEDDWRIGDLLTHLSLHFNKTLESFTLEIENDLEMIDLALVQMVEKCQKLHHLDLNAVLSTPTVDQICHLQSEGKINLQSLYITMAGVPESDTQSILCEIRERYSDMIDALNLDFQFTADVISSHEVYYVQNDEVVHVHQPANVMAVEQ